MLCDLAILPCNTGKVVVFRSQDVQGVVREAQEATSSRMKQTMVGFGGGGYCAVRGCANLSISRKSTAKSGSVIVLLYVTACSVLLAVTHRPQLPSPHLWICNSRRFIIYTAFEPRVNFPRWRWTTTCNVGVLGHTINSASCGDYFTSSTLAIAPFC